MWNKTILFIIICIMSSCGTSVNVLSSQPNDVRLTISTSKDTIDNFVTIDVSFENNTINDF
jgi:hypothetical protein